MAVFGKSETWTTKKLERRKQHTQTFQRDSMSSLTGETWWGGGIVPSVRNDKELGGGEKKRNDKATDLKV